MNSKKNSFKRVAAGALAVLTVAAYTAPVANVGGLPTVNSLVAEAATADTLVTFGSASNYITSATDQTTSASNEEISKAHQYSFAKNTVLTIKSKVPLVISDVISDEETIIYDNYKTYGDNTSGALPTTTDLLKKDANGDYVYPTSYTVSYSNATYTYKVRVVTGLKIEGETTSVNVVNVTKDAEHSGLIRTGDKTKVALTAVEGVDIFVNDTNRKLFTGPTTTDGIEVGGGLVKKSTAKIYAAKAFEVYIQDRTNTQAPLVQVVAAYDSEIGMFVADAPIPATTKDADAGQNVTIYLNKVTPKYTYAVSGATLTATATNAPKVTAASITATYEQKVKKTKQEQAAGESKYKYDKPADMTSGAKVPNESRVVLTFKNDTTHEVTSYKDSDTPDYFYDLKITKDGKEIDVNDANITPFVEIYTAYNEEAGNSDIAYKDIKTEPGEVVPNDGWKKAVDDFDEADGVGKLAFSATGVYKVEYTVYTKTVSNNKTTYTPRVLTYNFTISPRTALTAKNVRLTAEGKLKGGDEISKVGIVDGVVQFEVSEDWTANDIIEVTPTLFDKTEDAAGAGASTFAAGATDADGNPTDNGTPKSVYGVTKSCTLGAVNEMTVYYSNNEYGSSTQSVKIKWSIVEAKKAITIEQSEDYLAPDGSAIDYPGDVVYNEDEVAYFKTSIDNIKTIREDLLNTVTVENAELDDIKFEYVEGFGLDADDKVLNYHKNGLPTKVGKYTVIFIYEGETICTCNVEVGQKALYAKLTSAQTSYTYGTEKLETEDITFVDTNGKTVSDAGVKNASIKYYPTYRLTAAQIKKVTDDDKITITKTANGNLPKDADKEEMIEGTFKVYTIGSNKYIVKDFDKTDEIATTPIPDPDTVDGYIDAGVYIVVVSAEEDVTTVGKSGYDLMPSAFAVSVAKKAITADMVVFDAVDYTGEEVNPAGYKVVDTSVKDGVDSLDISDDVSIAGNITAATAVGEYSVDVQVTEPTSNYTGKATAKWHVVKPGKYRDGIVFTDTKTTIYDNGQIHFEITRPDNTQFENKIVKFGVIIDKEGKIAAPAKVNVDGVMKYPRKADFDLETGEYDEEVNPDFEAARKALQIGNGFKEGNQPKNPTDPYKYGANIEILDVDTGAWFRSYVIDEKGNIFYGEVIYVNLVQEATDALKLTMANGSEENHLVADDVYSGLDTVVVTKDEAKEDQSADSLAGKLWRKDVQSGYDAKSNRYYVYGSYTLEGNDLVKNSAVQGFGIVVDKKGAFTPAGNGEGAGVLASDGKTTVADGLVLGKGFIEGKGGSNKMDADEYGAMIVPANSVTGVWVRAYVNLGKAKKSNKELIVYTDPVYITDVSTYYNADEEAFSAGVNVENASAGVDRITFTANTEAEFGEYDNLALAGAKFKNSGAIVDTTGKYLAKETLGINAGDYTNEFAEGAETKANAEMLLGKGFLQGRVEKADFEATVKYSTFNAAANGTITRIPLVVRPYIVYTINEGTKDEKDVTIYGAPKIYIY